MAIYHLAAKIITRSSGRSATAAAAYRAAELVRDVRTGEVYDYTRKGGVEHRVILAPDNAPPWMRDREQLWNAVEAVERRKDAQLAREVEVCLPRELSRAQRLELVREFVLGEFVAQGMIADVAFHNPRGDDGLDRPHAHILLTMRELTGDGFGTKNRDWNDKDRLIGWRERWAECANRALERSGYDVRIDHRSLADQGLDREAQPKLGAAAAMERRGEITDRGEEWRHAAARNEERSRLFRQLEAIRRVLEVARARVTKTLRGGRKLAHQAYSTAKDRICVLLGRIEQPEPREPNLADRASPERVSNIGLIEPTTVIERDELLGRRGKRARTVGALDRDALLGRESGRSDDASPDHNIIGRDFGDRRR